MQLGHPPITWLAGIDAGQNAGVVEVLGCHESRTAGKVRGASLEAHLEVGSRGLERILPEHDGRLFRMPRQTCKASQAGQPRLGAVTEGQECLFGTGLGEGQFSMDRSQSPDSVLSER